MKMIKTHEGGMLLIAITGEIGQSVSTFNTIVKDKDWLKEVAKGIMPLIIIKKKKIVLAPLLK